MNDYEQQAIDLVFYEVTLLKTGTTFKAEFLKHDKHFTDDKETRDIYLVTLIRGERSYTFKYGQSLTKSITPEYRNKVKNQRKYLVSLFPTPYDVLSCLQKYDVGSFEDFCNDFGYDSDSKKAEKIYNAVKEEYRNLQFLFTDAEMEQLQEIQ